MSGRPSVLCRIFWAPVGHFPQLMASKYQWSLPDKMSGKIWALCRTSAKVCWTCPACPAYFAITASTWISAYNNEAVTYNQGSNSSVTSDFLKMPRSCIPQPDGAQGCLRKPKQTNTHTEDRFYFPDHLCMWGNNHEASLWPMALGKFLCPQGNNVVLNVSACCSLIKPIFMTYFICLCVTYFQLGTQVEFFVKSTQKKQSCLSESVAKH